MFAWRGFAAVVICISLFVYPAEIQAGLSPPMGILTHAQDAWLNSSEAFPGLSVFEGESLSTGEEGKLGIRVGPATLAFSHGALASLQKLEGGTHVDLAAGSVFFAAPQSGMVEVHAADAVFRPEKKGLTRAEVRVLQPKVLQVSAIQGNLEFSYREEFQLIPEGETYRIYLDAPAEAQKPAGAGVPSVDIKKKTVFYIVAGAAVIGLTAWGIHKLTDSDLPVSPSRPH